MPLVGIVLRLAGAGARGWRPGVLPASKPCVFVYNRSLTGVSLLEYRASRNRESWSLRGPPSLPRPFFPFLPRRLPRLRRALARNIAGARLSRMSRRAAAAGGGVLLRQLPDAVFERLSVGFRRPLRFVPRRASRFRRRVLLRRLSRLPPRTDPSLQIRQSQDAGASARRSPGGGDAPRRTLRRRCARAVALASAMAKGVQSIGVAGAGYRPAHRYTGRPRAAPGALHVRAGRSKQYRPASKRDRRVCLPAGRRMGPADRGETHSSGRRCDDDRFHGGCLRTGSQAGGSRQGRALDRRPRRPANGRLARRGGAFHNGGTRLNGNRSPATAGPGAQRQL